MGSWHVSSIEKSIKIHGLGVSAFYNPLRQQHFVVLVNGQVIEHWA